MDHGTDRAQLARAARLVAVFALILLTAAGAPWPPSTPAGAATTITDFTTPGRFPWGTAFDANGRVWVALPGCDPSPTCSSSTPPGKLAQFDPVTNQWKTVVSLPAGYGQPLFVAMDSSGKVWFTMPVTNAIGTYDPVARTVAQYAVPTASSGPWGIAVAGDGTIWFTEHYTNKVGTFDPRTQTFHEISTPAPNSNPYGITIDRSGNVWFTENTDAVALIGEYSAQTGLREFRIRSGSTAGTGLTPHLITTDRNGNVWWSEGWVSAIAQLDVSRAVPGTNAGVTEFDYTPSCTSCGAHTSGIGTDSLGSIWFDDSLQNVLGSIPMTGGAFTWTKTPSGGHPHDGLNVDGNNRIWFDEEFADRLAVATQSGSTTTSTTSTSTTSTTAPATTSTTSSGTTTTLGTDTFHRPDQSMWGIASDGQTWGGDANTSGVFSIHGNAGLVSKTNGNSYSAVLGPSTTNQQATMTGAITTFANTNFGDVLRWTDTNNWYKAFVDGTNLVIQKRVSGTTTVLATVPFPTTPGVTYSIHFRVVGTTLTANAWPASTTEPAGWMLTTTDTAIAAGRAGLRINTQGGTLTITAFQADTP